MYVYRIRVPYNYMHTYSNWCIYFNLQSLKMYNLRYNGKVLESLKKWCTQLKFGLY